MQKEIETVQKILSNKECVKEILATNNEEELKKIFENNGVILSKEQIEATKKVFANAINSISELDSKELENITGGTVNRQTLGKHAEIGSGVGVLVGGLIGGTIGGTYAMIDTAMKAKKEDTFIKNVCKVVSKTTSAMIICGAAGMGLGAAGGAASGVIASNL